ncbi:uracil phosphoribosyltransferase [Asanoa siamensis]|uniref:uracil phosphoribosyltransferase n=1 Tax=Asanoa siamensis TaxID=926357 RepID=UPI001941D539|nr:uracil phosphoribosyltransferase [Asanoa siamensis]
MDELTRALLCEVRSSLGRQLDDAVPVLILRGGLLMREACQHILGDRPWGFVSTAPRSRGEPARIRCCDVPLPTGPLLLMDPVVNSGQTIVATTEYLTNRIASLSTHRLAVVSIFLSERGENKIRRSYPDMDLFTVYDRLPVRENGWIAGVDFDAGEYAMGGEAFRIG